MYQNFLRVEEQSHGPLFFEDTRILETICFKRERRKCFIGQDLISGVMISESYAYYKTKRTVNYMEG